MHRTPKTSAWRNFALTRRPKVCGFPTKILFVVAAVSVLLALARAHQWVSSLSRLGDGRAADRPLIQGVPSVPRREQHSADFIDSLACKNGHAAVVEELLARGASANSEKKNDGMTPLFMAQRTVTLLS